MGKTMLLRKFLRDNATSFETQRTRVRAAASRGSRSHAGGTDPRKPSSRAGAEGCWGSADPGSPRHGDVARACARRLFRMLRELGTRDAHDRRDQFDPGRQPTAAAAVSPIACASCRTSCRSPSSRAGVPEARFALLSDPQLRSRVAETLLEPWTSGPEFQAFVNILVQGLPLRRPATTVAGGQRQVASAAGRALRWHHPVDMPGLGARWRRGHPQWAGAHRTVRVGGARDLAKALGLPRPRFHSAAGRRRSHEPEAEGEVQRASVASYAAAALR